MRPRYITAMRWLMCRITARSWLTNRKARPYSSCRSISRLRTCACTETSSAETGSSATMISGRTASARAMPRRWRWPPENSCGYLRIASGRSPTRWNSAATRSSVSRPRDRPKFSIGSPTMAPADRRGLREEYGSWKTVWMRRRCSHIAPGDSAVTSSPATTMRPEVGSTSLSTARPTVDLPQPDSPTRPSVSPCATEKLTPSTARTSPALRPKTPLRIGKCFTRSRTSRLGRAAPAAGLAPLMAPPSPPRSRRRGGRRASPRAPGARRGSAPSPARSAARRRSRRSGG